MSYNYHIKVRKVTRNDDGYVLETITNMRNLYRVSDIERMAREQLNLWIRDSSGKIPGKFSLVIKFQE